MQGNRTAVVRFVLGTTPRSIQGPDQVREVRSGKAALTSSFGKDVKEIFSQSLLNAHGLLLVFLCTRQVE